MWCFWRKFIRKGTHTACVCIFFRRWWAFAADRAVPAKGTIVSGSSSILRDLKGRKAVWWKNPTGLSLNWGDKPGWEGETLGKNAGEDMKNAMTNDMMMTLRMFSPEVFVRFLKALSFSNRADVNRLGLV